MKKGLVNLLMGNGWTGDWPIRLVQIIGLPLPSKQTPHVSIACRPGRPIAALRILRAFPASTLVVPDPRTTQAQQHENIAAIWDSSPQPRIIDPLTDLAPTHRSSYPVSALHGVPHTAADPLARPPQHGRTAGELGILFARRTSHKRTWCKHIFRGWRPHFAVIYNSDNMTLQKFRRHSTGNGPIQVSKMLGNDSSPYTRIKCPHLHHILQEGEYGTGDTGNLPKNAMLLHKNILHPSLVVQEFHIRDLDNTMMVIFGLVHRLARLGSTKFLSATVILFVSIESFGFVGAIIALPAQTTRCIITQHGPA
ncbi:hypothetical protein B0H17DRAFT_1150210 [Mycena rosella]|uniref:Uncharacterized protein n=1 Tax=Mycena rosella TaxID=1033263 RepID=A0AAD7BV37_MYCRO|nr:hypothetical protein B0H17DRAFT_1150210 [Mycena rosella]